MRHDGPLRTHKDGSPLLYSSLSVELYLEPPDPSHSELVEAAMGLVADWVGPSLRWTHMSTLGEPERFEVGDLSHVVEHVRGSGPRSYASDPSSFGARVEAATVRRFSLVAHGAEEDWDASPVTVRYHAESFGSAAAPTWASMLRVSVPATSSLEDFRARAYSLAAGLPVRWGIAGLALVGWDVDHFYAVHDATYALGRKHPGFDISLYSLHMDTWFRRLRTVSWLTFLGPSFQELLLRAGGVVPELAPSSLALHRLGNGVLALEAPAPDPGDTNRHRMPPGYAAADRIVRPIRAASRLHFTAPWTERTTEEWLRRFESSAN